MEVESRLGQSRKRTGADGKPRFTAYYEDFTGTRRSAGTFTSQRQADRAWHAAETKVAEGRMGNSTRGGQRFRTYVLEQWLPNHLIELTTRQRYTYQLHSRILPAFGDYRMAEVLPSHVRQWIAEMQHDGIGAPTIKYCMIILGAIFTTALNDQVTFLHPCVGVKTPPIPTKPRRIITPAQFDAIHDALPTDHLRLFIETSVETGLRWGELVELRPQDIDCAASTLTVSRVAVELRGKHAPAGGPFIVKPYPKDKEWRRIALSSHITAQLAQHLQTLNPQDLLLPAPRTNRAPIWQPEPVTAIALMGLTEPTEAGFQYPHGTLSGYNAGRCRCRHCRDACASYRARRTESGLDRPRRTTDDTPGNTHIARGWFRTKVWLPTLDQAGLGFHVRVHDLRHAHASWLLAGGADLNTVKERMGHSSIATTEKYLHTLPTRDHVAITALDAIRGRT